MEIWPAIDLRDGRCVRLQQGDYGRETIFSDDPAEMAAHWVRLGAHRLHVVDLDGARSGKPANIEVVKEILDACKVPIQLGGGVRDDATIDMLLELGVSRVVVGTKALQEPEWFAKVCAARPGKVALGVDARDGHVATDGWMETSRTSAFELVKKLADIPFAAIIFTDIATDGMLAGPNLGAMAAMKEAAAQPVIASGGVTTIDDVKRLAMVPMAGAIVGRALYEGRIHLPDALAAAGDNPPSSHATTSRDFLDG